MTAYDGFLSYSHAADGLLAPRLHSGLQRFAKPWWKRRATRIFRDESSLSANPHLWSSITDALDASAWFILLLSPAAAESPWVTQEIEYWRANKPGDRILPVVTDGDFAWGGADVVGTAVPERLHGMFSEEPRWVDLRFAKDEEQLDLKDPRFADAVADIASALRGVPKDELASEEVKQHRRTVRTAWSAAGVLLVLAIVATTALVIAKRQGDIARAEALVASGRERLSSDPELSVLLAIEALRYERAGDSGAEEVLTQALLAHRTTGAYPTAGRSGPFATHAVTADAASLAIWNWETGSIRSVALPMGDVHWERAGVAKGRISAGAFSDDGRHLLLLDSGWEIPDGAEIGAIVILDAASGELLERIQIGVCPIELFPHQGAAVDIDSMVLVEWGHQVGGNCDASSRQLGTVDLRSGATSVIADKLSAPDAVGRPTMAGDTSVVAFSDLDSTRIVDAISGETIRVFEHSRISTLDQGGSRILIGQEQVELRAVDTGDLLGVFPVAGAVDASFVGSDLILVSESSGAVRLFESGGELVAELLGHASPAGKMSVSRDTKVAVTEAEGSIRIWDLEDLHVGEQPELVPPEAIAAWPFGGLEVTDAFTAVPYVVQSRGSDTRYALANDAGDRVRLAGQVGPFDLSSDGELIVQEPWVPLDETPSGRHAGKGLPLVSVDAETGEVVTSFDGCGYWLDYERNTAEGELDCPAFMVVSDIEISSNGARVAAVGGLWRAAVWDLATGERIWESEPLDAPFIWDHEIAISPDGSQVIRLDLGKQGFTLTNVDTGMSTAPIGEVFTSAEILFHSTGDTAFVADHSGNVSVIDVERWEIERILSNPTAGELYDAALDSDGDRLSVVGSGGILVEWDWRRGVPIRRLRVGAQLAHVAYDKEDLLIIGVEGETVRIPGDQEALLAIAQSRLTRSFTESECAIYRIDPCPAGRADGY